MQIQVSHLSSRHLSLSKFKFLYKPITYNIVDIDTEVDAKKMKKGKDYLWGGFVNPFKKGWNRGFANTKPSAPKRKAPTCLGIGTGPVVCNG